MLHLVFIAEVKLKLSCEQYVCWKYLVAISSSDDTETETWVY